MAKKIIIGLTGRFGAGCSSTLEVLKETFDYIPFSLSDYIKNIAKKDDSFKFLGDKNTRKKLQALGDILRDDNNDQAFLANIILKKLKNTGSKNIIIDGFKNPAEVNAFRKEYADFFLFAIDAETKERWRRTKHIYNEDKKLFNEDDERDRGTNKYPYKGQQVKACMNIADILINSDKPFFNDNEDKNEKAIEEYGQKITSYLELIEKPGSISPNLDELYMHLAVSMSLRSNCLKRQVGAVIIKSRNYIISAGNNDVPKGEIDCKEYNNEKCYRDSELEKFFKSIKKLSNCNDIKNKISIPGKLLDLCRAVHAEEEAILQAAKLGVSINETTLYTSTEPCLLCCKKIINSGIKEIVYLESYPIPLALEMLENCGIVRRKFEGVTSRVYNKLFSREILI